MHMMLVGRCLERIGDNAVDIGEQTAFVVTGLFREFEDASHPELAPPIGLICACIDIGSNTTRLLVADAGDGSLRELVTQRAFTRIGKSLGRGRRDPAARRSRRPPRSCARRRAVAREVGAEQVVAVATAAIRNAPNRAELVGAVEEAGRHAARRSCPARRRPGSRSWAPRARFVGPARRHDRRHRRGRGVDRDRDRRAGRARGVVRVVSGRLRVPGRRLPALRPAVGGRAREGAPARGRRLRGPRAAAGRQRRGRGRNRHLAAPPPRRGAGARNARARHPRALSTPIAEVAAALRARPRARAPAAGRDPRAGGDLRPAAACRCASRAAACARACCSSWWREGGLPRSTAIALQLGRPQEHGELAAVDARQAALLHAHPRAGEVVDGVREVRIVAHQQHVVAEPGGERARRRTDPPASLGSSCGSTPSGVAGEPRGVQRRGPWDSSGRHRAPPRAAQRLPRGPGLGAALVGQRALRVGRALRASPWRTARSRSASR